MLVVHPSGTLWLSTQICNQSPTSVIPFRLQKHIEATIAKTEKIKYLELQAKLQFGSRAAKYLMLCG